MMKSGATPYPQTLRGSLLIAGATAFALALALLAFPAHADRPRPSVPANLEVPPGNKAYLEGFAVGTQNYFCLPTGWTFFGPQATLFNDGDQQIITHFLSPNPDEGGTARATWQHSKDTSAVWAAAIASSTDPVYVEPGAIPWLLLQIVGAEEGPTGGDKLADTTFIQRINTSGGIAPSTGCAVAGDVGKRALVPYTTDYVFYRASGRPGHGGD